MKFKSYNEIENSYNAKFLKKIHEYGFDKPERKYACFTKVDGSNFQCSIDDKDEFIVGTRSRFLERGEAFQGYERAMINQRVKESLLKLKSYLKSNTTEWNKIVNTPNAFDLIVYNEIVNDPNGFILTIYGELCGGFYRHPDVEKIKGAVKIQGRIDYHPDNVWIPFDGKIISSDETKVYQFNVDELKRFCDIVNLPCQIEKFRGTLDECLNYPNDFVDDTGHILFGLPIIPENITEGVVIKPVIPVWLGNERIIIKNKNDKFKERMCKAHKEKVPQIPMNELELKYFNILCEYMTESRLYSVFSKVGEIDQKTFGKIMGLFIQDLLKDFDKEYSDEINKLENELDVDKFNFRKIKGEIQKEAANFIRPMFIQKLNE